MSFQLPPLQANEHNQLRKVGFELEFTGVDLDQSARIITELFGGKHFEENRFVHKVIDSKYGTFFIEIDSAILKEKTYEEYLERLGFDVNKIPKLQSVLEDVLDSIVSTVVPYEIVTPPIPMTEMVLVEELRMALQERKALGTKASPIYAFGLHINPETPSREVKTLLEYLRAFLLLYDWIFEDSNIDITRRVSPFIHEFPDAYIRLILDPEYNSDMAGFIEDYLRYSPTRNRPLDLLPLMASIDEVKVKSLTLEKEVRKGLIKPRPAFHYRLPNCLIDDPSWTISAEWDYWIQVEKLATDPSKVREMSRDFLGTMNSSGNAQRRWVESVREWIA